MASNSRKTGVLAVATAGVMLLAIYMIFFYLPPIKGEAGEVLSGSFRIFFFHMPIAIIAYLAFGVVFAASILYLREKSLKWDIYARSAAEVGTLFAFLVLVTGSIWAKDAWGWYWIWDLRLTTSLVLFLVYLAYMMLRKALEEPEKRARLSGDHSEPFLNRAQKAAAARMSGNPKPARFQCTKPAKPPAAYPKPSRIVSRLKLPYSEPVLRSPP